MPSAGRAPTRSAQRPRRYGAARTAALLSGEKMWISPTGGSRICFSSCSRKMRTASTFTRRSIVERAFAGVEHGQGEDSWAMQVVDGRPPGRTGCWRARCWGEVGKGHKRLQRANYACLSLAATRGPRGAVIGEAGPLRYRSGASSAGRSPSSGAIRTSSREHGRSLVCRREATRTRTAAHRRTLGVRLRCSARTRRSLCRVSLWRSALITCSTRTCRFMGATGFVQ